jgi:ZIP family zinc transporter
MILIPILLSLIAGSATGIGGLIVLKFGEVSDRKMGLIMGFAGGVMLVVSFLDLYAEAVNLVDLWKVNLAFALGIAFMILVDFKLPQIELGLWEDRVKDRFLLNSGIVIAIGMSIHNFPEGIVIAAGYSHAAELGLLVAIIICFHNIPEGIATVGPLIKAGVPKWRAVGLATLGGLMEPLGALLGTIVISYFGVGFVGWALGFAAGVMTYVTIDELIPVAYKYCTLDQKDLVSTGVLIGILLALMIGMFLHS